MQDKSELKRLLQGAVEYTKPGAKRDEDLPIAEDDEDIGPCGMVQIKGCRALDVDRGAKHPIVSMQYVYISVRSEFMPGKFWVLFVGLDSWKITVEGRNLRSLYDRCNDHCLRRIRVAGERDFGQDDGKAFVTKITIEDVTPRDEEPKGKKSDFGHEKERQITDDKPVTR